MKLEWIAAALNPYDVAPHPNFMSSESVRPPSMLALLSGLRWTDYDRIMESTHPEGGRPSTPKLEHPDTVEMQAVRAVRKSLEAESVDIGATELQELVADDSLDGACRASLALFAAVAWSELEKYDSAIAVLEAALERVSPPGRNDEDIALVRAVLKQQLAFRLLESGEEGRVEAAEALELVRTLRATDLSTFSTSRGVRWPSSHTLRLILDELHWVSDAHLANLDRTLESKEWVRFVRAPTPDLTLRITRRAKEGLTKYVKERFEAHTGSTARTFFSSDPVEPRIFAALLHQELMGAASSASAWRSDLARLRVLRARDGVKTWALQDAIRLFRQADDRKSLNLVLRSVRAQGPLSALEGDARQVIRNRMDSAPIRRVELAVLSAASHLLENGDASRALDFVLGWIADGPTVGRWEASSVALEDGWMAAVQLAAPAEQLDEVALSLLEAARESDGADELLVRGLARAARAIDWEGTGDATQERWRAWLDQADSQVAETLTDAIGLDLGVSTRLEDRPPLERAASFLNRYYRTGVVPSDREVEIASSVVVEALEAIRQSAERGTYSFGALSPADITAGLIADLSVSELWRPLREFLLDNRVARPDKEPALERLAREAPLDMPERDAQAFRSDIYELLETPSVDLFDQGMDPFPAALRFAAAFNLIPAGEVLNGVARLGGPYGTPGRVESARTLVLLARLEETPPWTPALSIYYSHDGDAVVRGEAGRCLAMLHRVDGRPTDGIEARVAELLQEDGLVVPVLVLKGLRESRSPLPEALRTEVELLGEEHAALGIRLEAQALLAD